MIFAKLGAVALVKDNHNALIPQRGEALFIGAFALLFVLLCPFTPLIERKPEFLNRGDDHFVGVIFGEQSANQCSGVGVLFDTPRLKFVKFDPRLAVEVFAIDHKQTLFNLGVILQ